MISVYGILSLFSFLFLFCLLIASGNASGNASPSATGKAPVKVGSMLIVLTVSGFSNATRCATLKSEYWGAFSL